MRFKYAHLTIAMETVYAHYKMDYQNVFVMQVKEAIVVNMVSK